MLMGFLGGRSAKDVPANAEDTRDVFDPWVGIPWSSAGNPLQYSCLENLMDREVWRAIVLRVTKSWTQLSDLVCAYMYVYVYYDSEKRHDEK